MGQIKLKYNARMTRIYKHIFRSVTAKKHRWKFPYELLFLWFKLKHGDSFSPEESIYLGKKQKSVQVQTNDSQHSGQHI